MFPCPAKNFVGNVVGKFFDVRYRPTASCKIANCPNNLRGKYPDAYSANNIRQKTIFTRRTAKND